MSHEYKKMGLDHSRIYSIEDKDSEVKHFSKYWNVLSGIKDPSQLTY